MDANELEFERRVAECRLTEAFFEAMALYPEGFTADEVYELAREKKIAPIYLGKSLGVFFRRYKTSGYLKKLPTYRMSSRGGSSPLPVWVRAESVAPKENLRKCGQLGTTRYGSALPKQADASGEIYVSPSLSNSESTH